MRTPAHQSADEEARKSGFDKKIHDRKMNRKKVARSLRRSGAEHRATMKESDLRTGRTTVLWLRASISALSLQRSARLSLCIAITWRSGQNTDHSDPAMSQMNQYQLESRCRYSTAFLHVV
jgi:hypothetical protein